jgi:hypothetical protein
MSGEPSRVPSSAASSTSDVPITGTSPGEHKWQPASNNQLDKEEKKVRRELEKMAKEQDDAEEHVSYSFHSLREGTELTMIEN